MPVQLQVIENGHALLYRVSDPWTVRQAVALYGQDRAHRDAAPYPVHTVLDLRMARKMPVGLAGAGQSSPGINHPNSGQMIFIGSTLLLRAVALNLLRLLNFNDAVFFNDEDSAMRYLRALICDENSYRDQ